MCARCAPFGVALVLRSLPLSTTTSSTTTTSSACCAAGSGPRSLVWRQPAWGRDSRRADVRFRFCIFATAGSDDGWSRFVAKESERKVCRARVTVQKKIVRRKKNVLLRYGCNMFDTTRREMYKRNHYYFFFRTFFDEWKLCVFLGRVLVYEMCDKIAVCPIKFKPMFFFVMKTL